MKTIEIIQRNSLDGGFLQSESWRKFQESVGRKTFHLESGDFWANMLEHKLPVVGKYFYIPRGPVMEVSNGKNIDSFKINFSELMNLAKKNNAGWVRIDPADDEILATIRKDITEKIVKAPHDMQPREIFVIDITKPENQLLEEMKSKTRYNINIAKKKGVILHSTEHGVQNEKYIEAFLRLTREMAARQGITAHPEEYYRKMIEILSDDMLKIYVAEYEGKIIAANLVLFFGKYATYLHGASGGEHRNVMAPFLLQWQAILDAKKLGCTHYDFGGVKTQNVKRETRNDWEGITKFKTGFSPNTDPVVFSGSYDIIINPMKYTVYRGLQKTKEFIVKMRK